ncbi:hypothetical protein POM88_051558 [Heracleum sosnowskyi]|uniref:Uncharacterized protein n=1 Tax=Heracleum sosnowskyi TaxID=360622 RepID=A0AAD8H236_9APIA|nr:hypothetical protein POM88_051558 [Heracleum sosnowskyi]
MNQPPVAALSNEDILPLSPKKARTGAQDHRDGDCRSALGSKKRQILYPKRHQMQIVELLMLIWILENESQYVQIIRRRLINDDGGEVSAVRFSHAPLDIPFWAASKGGAHRSLSLVSSSKVVSLSDIGGFFDTTTLRECMKQIAARQGLEGVSLDCADILNNGLDAYFKGFYSTCRIKIRA